jgi:hypothetical protein
VADANITCSPIVCPYSTAPVSLAAACTSALPGASVSYTINGVAAPSANCPSPVAPFQIRATVEGYLGTCNYDGPYVSVECERPRSERERSGRHDIFVSPSLCPLRWRLAFRHATASPSLQWRPLPQGVSSRPALSAALTPLSLPHLAATCEGPEYSDAFTCTPPKCTIIGERKKLVGSCTSDRGQVAYFDGNGTQIFSVRCPATDSDAVFVQPRALAGNGCSIKGPKFSVVGGWPPHVACLAPAGQCWPWIVAAVPRGGG